MQMCVGKIKNVISFVGISQPLLQLIFKPLSLTHVFLLNIAIHYCGAEHQKDDWKRHKELCKHAKEANEKV